MDSWYDAGDGNRWEWAEYMNNKLENSNSASKCQQCKHTWKCKLKSIWIDESNHNASPNIISPCMQATEGWLPGRLPGRLTELAELCSSLVDVVWIVIFLGFRWCFIWIPNNRTIENWKKQISKVVLVELSFLHIWQFVTKSEEWNGWLRAAPKTKAEHRDSWRIRGLSTPFPGRPQWNIQMSGWE